MGHRFLCLLPFPHCHTDSKRQYWFGSSVDLGLNISSAPHELVHSSHTLCFLLHSSFYFIEQFEMNSSFRLFFHLQVLGCKWPLGCIHRVFVWVGCFLECFVIAVPKLTLSSAWFPWGGHVPWAVSTEQFEARLRWGSHRQSRIPDEAVC